MKRKLNVGSKRTSMILLGAALMYLFSSCAANDKSENYKNISHEAETVDFNETNNKEQYSETGSVGNEQGRVFIDVSNGQGKVSVDADKEQPQVSADTDSEQSNDASVETDEQLPLSLEESYKAVLLDNGDFIRADMQNKKINLANIKEVVTDDDSITVAANKFAIIDLNNDGKNEVILWLQINGVSDFGFEILRYQEGLVYGYTLPYRAFMNLKTDGTFIFSSGAADSGIGKLNFSENGYVVDKLYDMSHQEEKDNAEWYDLTDDNVRTVFGQ